MVIVRYQMLDNTETIFVAIGILLSFILLYSSLQYCKDNDKETHKNNRLQNTRKLLTVKHRIKPIIETTDYEQCEIRNIENTGHQNV